MLQTTTFRVIALKSTKALECPACGTKVRRQRTFEQTVSPFNQRDGREKTVPEIYAELGEEASAWAALPVVCTPCQNGATT